MEHDDGGLAWRGLQCLEIPPHRTSRNAFEGPSTSGASSVRQGLWLRLRDGLTAGSRPNEVGALAPR